MSSRSPRDLFNHILENIHGKNFNELVDYVINCLCQELSRLDNRFSEPSLSSCCGHVFTRGELIFHCKDCAIDETCVLCQSCFQIEAHKTHRYKYYPSKESGGSCDCGETESWRQNLQCPSHVPSEASELKSDLIERYITNFLGEIVNSLRISLFDEPLPGERISLILYNDELHSFDQVIQVVNFACGISEEEASRLAHAVDQQGLAMIAEYDQNDTNLHEACIILSRVLYTEKKGSHTVAHQLAINVAIKALLELLKLFPQIRSIVLRVLVLHKFNSAEFLTIDDNASLAELLFYFDNQLWKLLRKSFQEILTVGLGYQDVKLEILSLFQRHTHKLINELYKGTREPHLSALNFAVQIFTVPSLAQEAARSEFIYSLFGYLEEAFQTYIPRSGSTKIPKTFLTSLIHLIHMITYIVTDKSVCEKGCIDQVQITDKFISALSPLQNAIPYKRLVEEHVYYEDSSWINEANLALIIRNFLIDIIQESSVFHLAAADIYKISESLSSKLWDFNPTAEVLSFMHPLVWLVAESLIKESLYSHGISNVLQFPKPIISEAVTALVNFARIDSKEWVRNGIAVSGQAAIAQGGMPQGYTYTYLTIIWYSFIYGEGEFVLEQLRNQFLGQQERSASIFMCRRLIDILMTLIFGVKLQTPLEESIQILLVNFLALGPTSHSDIIKTIPDWASKHQNFDEIFSSISVLKASESPLSNTLYEISTEYTKSYSPYYWLYSEEDRTKSLAYMRGKFGFNKFDIIKSAVNPNVVKAFRDHENLLLNQLLHNCINNKKLRNYFEDVFSLHVVCQVPYELNDSELGMVREITGSWDENVKRSYSQYMKSVFRTTDLAALQDKKVDDLAQINAQRRKRAMEAMLQAQANFENFNIDAKSVLTEQMTLIDSAEPFETGTCLYCQEPLGQGTEGYGYLSFVDFPLYYSMSNVENFPTPPTLSGCFHLMHERCYINTVLLPRSHKCPLCASPVTNLIPMPLNVSSAISGQPPTKLSNIEFIDIIKQLWTGKLDLSKNFPKITSEGSCFKFERVSMYNNIDYMTDFMVTLCHQLLLSDSLNGGEMGLFLRRAKFLRAAICDLRVHTPSAFFIDVNFVVLQDFIKGNFDEEKLFTSFHQTPLKSLLLIFAYYFHPSTTLAESIPLILAITRIYLYSILLDLYDRPAPILKIIEQMRIHSSLVLKLLSLWFEIDFSYDDLGLLCPSDSDAQAHQAFLEQFSLIGKELDSNKLRKVRLFIDPYVRLNTLKELPAEYSLIYRDLPPRPSCDCDTRSDSIFCLFCLAPFCVSPNCKHTFQNHILDCSGHLGMFLVRESCHILLVSDSRLFMNVNLTHLMMRTIPAPYVNAYGDADPGFKQGGPLYFSKSRYDYIKKIWFSCGLRLFIASSRENQSLMDILVNTEADDTE